MSLDVPAWAAKAKREERLCVCTMRLILRLLIITANQSSNQSGAMITPTPKGSAKRLRVQRLRLMSCGLHRQDVNIAPYHLEEQAMQHLPASKCYDTWRTASPSSMAAPPQQQPPPATSGLLQMLGGLWMAS